MPATEHSGEFFQQYPTTEVRSARERQVTSRRAWRRGLPSAPVAADDNEPPAGRTAPARRSMALEALLFWTYSRQRAHAILRCEMDWVLWAMDRAGYIANPADCRKLHYDAALVHEAVLALGTKIAAMIIQAALFGVWPERMDPESPRPVPVEPSDRYDDHGWYVDADGIRREYLIRTFEIVSIATEEFEQVGRKRMKRTRATTRERVPVKGCVIQYDPEPEFIEANNRLVAIWQAARPVLMQALRDLPGEARFRDHVLAEDPVPLVAVAVAANDNEPLAANDNELVPARKLMNSIR